LHILVDIDLAASLFNALLLGVGQLGDMAVHGVLCVERCQQLLQKLMLGHPGERGDAGGEGGAGRT